MPLIISDALFNNDGSLLFSLEDESGLWGDVILVNGRPWPVMKVERRKYRFRILGVCDLAVMEVLARFRRADGGDRAPTAA